MGSRQQSCSPFPQTPTAPYVIVALVVARADTSTHNKSLIFRLFVGYCPQYLSIILPCDLEETSLEDKVSAVTLSGMESCELFDLWPIETFISKKKMQPPEDWIKKIIRHGREVEGVLRPADGTGAGVEPGVLEVRDKSASSSSISPRVG